MLCQHLPVLSRVAGRQGRELLWVQHGGQGAGGEMWTMSSEHLEADPGSQVSSTVTLPSLDNTSVDVQGSPHLCLYP